MNQELKREVFKLLKEDVEFRYTIAGLIGLDEVLKRLDGHEEQLVKLREDMNKGFARHDREIAMLREDMNRGFELLERHVSALGARWGMMSEEAFREGLKGLIEKELDFKVERWQDHDSEGLVFGYPSRVEVDVALHDDRIVLIELTSHATASSVYAFKRKSIFYEKTTGRKPSRLLMITPYADDKALEASKELQIELYTKV